MPDGSFNVTKTNLDVLIAHLEEVVAAGDKGWLDPVTGQRAGFFMGSWMCRLAPEHECGTAACMAGHCALLADPVRFWHFAAHDQNKSLLRDVPVIAARWLGIDGTVAYHLFHGRDERGSVFHFERITASEAVETLRRFRDTGRVDWSHARGYEIWRLRLSGERFGGSWRLRGADGIATVLVPE